MQVEQRLELVALAAAEQAEKESRVRMELQNEVEAGEEVVQPPAARAARASSSSVTRLPLVAIVPQMKLSTPRTVRPTASWLSKTRVHAIGKCRPASHRSLMSLLVVVVAVVQAMVVAVVQADCSKANL
jgi:hypothetical protein